LRNNVEALGLGGVTKVLTAADAASLGPAPPGRAVLAGVSRSALRKKKLAEKALVVRCAMAGWLTPSALLVVEEAQRRRNLRRPMVFEELERRGL